MAGRFRIGSKGAAVHDLQRALIAAGYELPKWGADGRLGSETWTAMMAFAEDRGLGGVWPQAERGKGHVPQVIVDTLLPNVPVQSPASLVDLTRLHPLKKGRRKPRRPARVNGIVLHQTATRLGGTHKRWYNVACHVGIPTSGDILYVNDLLAYVWHANGANRFSLGMEVDGLFEGVEGVRKTLWGANKGKVASKLSGKQIAAAREGVRWMVETARALGCPLTKIYAHRQFSAMRRSDPGSLIWKEVGLWAQEELGLENPRDFTLDDGAPIPREWDPRATHNYYGRKLKTAAADPVA